MLPQTDTFHKETNNFMFWFNAQFTRRCESCAYTMIKQHGHMWHRTPPFWVIGSRKLLTASCGCSHLHAELTTFDRITQETCWHEVWPGPQKQTCYMGANAHLEFSLSSKDLFSFHYVCGICYNTDSTYCNPNYVSNFNFNRLARRLKYTECSSSSSWSSGWFQSPVV